jgi:hypothetical protein
MKLFLRGFVLALLTSLSINSCTTTKITHTWAEKSYRGWPFSHILVIGVAEKNEIRRSFEEKFVAKLEATGVKGVESYAVMAPDEKIDKETILAVVKKTGVDGVLLTYLVAVKEKELASPGPTYSRADDYHGGSIPDLSSAYEYRSGSQLYTTQVKVRLETNLYDAETEQKVWSARSRTLNPKSDTALMNSVIDALVKDLKKNKLLP